MFYDLFKLDKEFLSDYFVDVYQLYNTGRQEDIEYLDELYIELKGVVKFFRDIELINNIDVQRYETELLNIFCK